MSHTDSLPPTLVTELNSNDVLMGRGSPSADYEGNLRFRQLVLDSREEYMQSTRHSEKHRIAQAIVQQVHNRGGRFLERITTAEEAQRLKVPPRTQAWKVIEASATLYTKVKQLMRDVGPETQQKRKDRRKEQRHQSRQAKETRPVLPEIQLSSTSPAAVAVEGTCQQNSNPVPVRSSQTDPEPCREGEESNQQTPTETVSATSRRPLEAQQLATQLMEFLQQQAAPSGGLTGVPRDGTNSVAPSQLNALASLVAGGNAPGTVQSQTAGPSLPPDVRLTQALPSSSSSSINPSNLQIGQSFGQQQQTTLSTMSYTATPATSTATSQQLADQIRQLLLQQSAQQPQPAQSPPPPTTTPADPLVGLLGLISNNHIMERQPDAPTPNGSGTVFRPNNWLAPPPQPSPEEVRRAAEILSTLESLVRIINALNRR